MITILLAPDAFKDSMSAEEACHAMKKGIERAALQFKTSINTITCPLADGGEGTLKTLITATGGMQYSTVVTGPLGKPVEAFYGISGDGNTGFVEMASASGLELVPHPLRNPLITTTYGTGELILRCLDHEIKELYIGIGGSATNDGGAGALQALGAKLLNEDDEAIGYGAKGLTSLRKLDLMSLDPRLQNIKITAACDVTNPLCGEKGATYVFGPQKGATSEILAEMDQTLLNFGKLMEETTGREVLEIPGSGAAGGLGAAILGVLGGELRSGIELVLALTGFEKKAMHSDYIFTGEGKIDSQTLQGKVLQGVCKTAKHYGKPCYGFAGRVDLSLDNQLMLGLTASYPISEPSADLSTALKQGKVNLEQVVYQATLEILSQLKSSE